MNKCSKFNIRFFICMLVWVSCGASIAKNQPLHRTDKDYMQIAIDLARKNPKAPFAALIVDNKTGEILATGLNASEIDPTFHGEMVAIHHLSEKPHKNGSNVTLYTTAEPCPMCQSAIIWANISRVVFATSIDYLAKHGWNQIMMSSRHVNHAAHFYHGTIKGGVLAKTANALFVRKDH